MVLFEAERTRVFFPIDQDKWAQALGQIRRLRSSNRLERISSSDRHWNAVFLAALVETVDSLLLEEPRQALELSAQGVLLAERIRPDECPGGTEVGKRSFRAWAHAVRGSACRASELYEEAEDAFAQATWLATSKVVLPWAAAEVDRRHFWLLAFRGQAEGLELINRSLKNFGDHAIGRAKALMARGVHFQHFVRDASQASLDLSAALTLLDPKRSAEEARVWAIGIHNLNYLSSVGCNDLQALQTTLRRVHALRDSFSHNQGYRRSLCLWTEALLMAPLGSTRGARRLLLKVRGWLERHAYQRAWILCTVDLIILLLREEEGQEAADLLADLDRQLSDGTAEPYLTFWTANQLSNDGSEANLKTFRDAVLGSRIPDHSLIHPSPRGPRFRSP